jgi:hypothetical protein
MGGRFRHMMVLIVREWTSLVLVPCFLCFSAVRFARQVALA